MMRIRQATKEDSIALAKLSRETITESWSERSFFETIGQPMTAVFLAELPEKKEIAGYGIYYQNTDIGELVSIAVRQKERRKGAGSQLMEAILVFAKQNGVACISMEVRKSNKSAIGLYQKFGFQVKGERPHFYRNPTEAAWILVRDFH